MSQSESTRRPHVWRLVIIVVIVLALVAGGIGWFVWSHGEYRDIGAGIGVSEGAPDNIKAVIDNKMTKPPFLQVQQLSPVMRITPDGPLAKPVTLRFKLNRKINDPRDVVIAVNQTGKPTDWQLVTPTKVDGEYAYFTATHLSWWDPLWRSFTDLVSTTVGELKRQFDGLSGNAFADAKKPTCNNEQTAREKGYSIKWTGAEVLYYCLGLDNNKPVVQAVNKRRYPIFINHAGVTVSNLPKAKLGVEWLARKSFSDKRTVLLPFDQVQLNFDLAKKQSKSITTEYNGFAESLYQLEFGVTTLINILTRYGAGAGTISNGAIKLSEYDKVAEAMSKALTVKDCANALNDDTPNSGAILSGCFSPESIASMFGWKGVLVAVVMVVGPVVNFFRNSFDTLGDLLQGKDQETVTVSYNPPTVPSVLFVGTWHVHGATLVIKPNGTGVYTWNAGPCATAANEFDMCTGNVTIKFKTTSASQMTGTYTNVWYTNASGSAAPDNVSTDPAVSEGKTFTIKRHDQHTLITNAGDDDGPGNPYFCDNYAMAHNDSTYALCGA